MSELREQLQAVLGEGYAIEREISGGGMSRLFLATERALRRPVVIKVLPRELTSAVSAARFQREIELAAQLQHPNILPVHAAGSKGGLLYYVMPYVPGESLRRRLQREPRLPAPDAVRILHEVADALAYAHHSGVVHRDIKPENILLEQGHAVLADFGIAKAVGGASSNRGATGAPASFLAPRPQDVTSAGVLLGTPAYMAPEQAAGERHVDARADVYALGIVGYEMLAGSPPFTGPNARAVLAAHLTQPAAPLAQLRPDAPAAVCDAIHRALAKAPADRFRTAAEFRDALARDHAERRTTGSIRVPVDAERVDAAPDSSRRAGRLGALVGGAQALWRRFRAPAVVTAAPVSPSTMAVLPFTVRGSERLAYLGEGMVDLLSTKLDGVAGLCVADPRAVLALAAREGARTFDPTSARGIAERVGAGRFVLGSLVEAGGRLQASATLYDTRGAMLGSAQAAADDEAQLFDLVDKLAIQLLAEYGTSSRATVAGLSAQTTRSLPALKAYLEGESRFRAGQFTLAKEAFRRAVDADSTFALAWYRLSVAAEWSLDRDLEDHAAEQALRHADRLPARDRQLLQAFVAWRRGSHAAEGMYRDIVSTFPNDVEAWFQLGEVQFHYGPLCGRPIADSREAWERVLSFQPEDLGALYHLTRIASVEGRFADLEEMTDRVLALSPQSERALEATALRAFRLGDDAEEQRVIEELDRAGDRILISIVRTVALYGSLDGAAALARLCTAPSRTAAVRALGHLQLAHLELARGHVAAAAAELDRAAALDPAAALETRAFVAVLPARAAERPELEEIRDALARWDPTGEPAADHASIFVRVHDGLHMHLRAYLLGLVHARLGDHAAAHRYATELQGLGGAPAQRALAHALADSVHAQVALARREAVAALTTLERSTLEVAYDLTLASPFYSRSYDRYTRATLLAGAGRHDEALRLFNSFAEVSIYDLALLAPSHLERGALYHRLGEPERAITHLERAVALWGTCDPELRPAVDEAEQRIGELRSTRAHGSGVEGSRLP